jgi:Uma2 family endonuclease
MAVIYKETKVLKPDKFKKKFSVNQFIKMYQSGIFKPDEKIELLNGEVFKLNFIELRHTIVVDKLTRILSEILLSNKETKEKFVLRVQNPVHLSRDSLPEPDLTVVSAEYLKENRFPKAKDIALLIEVSDSTVQKDKEIKLPIYAKAKIKEVWIIDLTKNHIEIYKKPFKNEYLEVEIKPIEKEIQFLNKKIPVKEI